jgi:hypothetical protein
MYIVYNCYYNYVIIYKTRKLAVDTELLFVYNEIKHTFALNLEVIMKENNKEQALSAAITQIERQYGKGAIMKLGENQKLEIETIPTGSLSLDIALGAGGIPKGRIVEIYGPESSGKTTVALHIIAEAQKLGGIAGFIDAEHALDPKYAKNIGVDIDNLYISGIIISSLASILAPFVPYTSSRTFITVSMS